MLSQWYSEGLIYRDFFTNNGMGPPQDAISSDTSFVWYGSVNEIPTLNSILKDDGAYITGMADVTRTPGETIHLGDNTARYVSLSQGYAVSTDCEHPEYVLQFFDYLYTDEGYMLANYGVEGETYTMENGTPTYTDMILNNDTYTYVSALFKYCLYEGPFALDVGRYYAAFSADQVAAVQTWESNRDEDWNLSTNVTLTTEESERSATLTQELGTYCSEMILKFIVGDLDVDENWDTFQEMLITLGAEEIVSINQTALDRYNAQ
jgi:putative aldouronate transport system substrate-binding protein